MDSLQSTMSRDVGIHRRNKRLQRAKRRLNHLEKEVNSLWDTSIPTRNLIELRNLIITAQKVTEAASARKANLGLHFNSDLVKEK